MQCDRCSEPINAEGGENFHGQVLCEDCYMDAFSPSRTCDPWAVRSAMHCKDSDGGTAVNALQARLLEILQETGGVSLDVLSERLGGKPADIQREIAALRHMEKVRGAMQDGKKVFRLW